jgi:hypothetical protein
LSFFGVLNASTVTRQKWLSALPLAQMLAHKLLYIRSTIHQPSLSKQTLENS